MVLLSYFVRSGHPENPKNLSRFRHIMYFIHNQVQDTKNDTISLILGVIVMLAWDAIFLLKTSS